MTPALAPSLHEPFFLECFSVLAVPSIVTSRRASASTYHCSTHLTDAFSVLIRESLHLPKLKYESK